MESTIVKNTVLNDLILINNDRIAGYEKAIEELGDTERDLVSLFNEMIAESVQLNAELEDQVIAEGGDIVSGTTTSGKIYRAWMDVKAFFGGHDRKTILSNCEAGEDAAQKAYYNALEMEDLPASTRLLISTQQQQLKLSHDRIRSLRDLQ